MIKPKHRSEYDISVRSYAEKYAMQSLPKAACGRLTPPDVINCAMAAQRADFAMVRLRSPLALSEAEGAIAKSG